MGLTNTPSDLLPGTLELLILTALVREAKHGYGIVEHLRVAPRTCCEWGNVPSTPRCRIHIPTNSLRSR